MNVEFQHNPGNTVAKITLSPGETVTSEGGAMLALSSGISLKTTTYKRNQGSLLKGLKRMFSGESFFVNHYTAPAHGGEIYLAPSLHGDIFQKELQSEHLIVQAGSYLASEPGIEVDFNYQGLKSLLSGESLFWLKIHGQGKVLLNSYGAIYPIEVDGEHIVDTGHIVAFSQGLNFNISKAGSSWMSSFLGGEGFVCRFKGKGTVWCQSHNPNSFGHIIGSQLKPR